LENEKKVKSEKDAIKKGGFPYLPDDVLDKISNLNKGGDDYSRITKTLIEDIQKPQRAGAKEFDTEELARAALIGVEVAQAILSTILEKHKRASKFGTLIAAFGRDPELRI